ncbi:nucleotide-sugar epimerase [Sea otter poxvirus]|uniref:3 beta-hydroxysteroid dehydrogenase/Delta 5-->4-isomerase n=1 Tax=Sea otter poxvirus TaxID=1416741 RepID=A0A2U9QHM5_9POXV|nr:nucleotide-sugar epimerase [Sea otter poxvirus]AWU47077.1 3 beta-hydroxysteroid dehydrogenase/5->4-isomerase [Sea otter poxvirus]
MANIIHRRLVYMVTGGNGFLGSAIVKMLLSTEERLAELRIVDKYIDKWLIDLDIEYTDVLINCIQADITDEESIRRASIGVDIVIHTASLVDVFGNYSDEEIMTTNVDGTQKLLDACVMMGVQNFIYTSSMESVGPNSRGDPLYRGDEATRYQTMHSHVYSKSKAVAEKLVLSYNGRPILGGKFMSTVVLRPTGIYGEGHKIMLDMYHKGRRMRNRLFRTIPTSVEHSRVYVGNVAWMHVLVANQILLRRSVISGQVYYCYDDSPYMSYEDFNMEFLRDCGIRLIGNRPIFSNRTLRCMVRVNSFLRVLLKPVYNYTPMLNKHTLTVATTPFTIETTKAFKHFGYVPLYRWQDARKNTINWLKCEIAASKKN